MGAFVKTRLYLDSIRLLQAFLTLLKENILNSTFSKKLLTQTVFMTYHFTILLGRDFKDFGLKYVLDFDHCGQK